MNLLFFASMFAKPIGAMINNALSAASAAVIVWAASKGFDEGITTPIVSGIVLVISQAISALAATQGVTIPIINADPANGVRVVDAKAAMENGLPKVDAPIPAPLGDRP